MKTISTTFAAAFAFAATVATFGLSAGPALAETMVPVTVTAADVATPAGRDALDARIARAARSACSVNYQERNLAAIQDGKRCVAAAVADAQPRLAQLKAGSQLASR